MHFQEGHGDLEDGDPNTAPQDSRGQLAGGETRPDLW
jgi:hypothetical protein